VVQSTRTCLDCLVDITHRHITAKRCKSCADRRNQEIWHNRKTFRRNKQRDCLDCGVDISYRHGLAIRCESCALTEAVRIEQDSKRKYEISKHVKYDADYCEWCNSLYVPARLNQRTCSAVCATVLNSSEQSAKRRTYLASLPYEDINYRSVFNRDSWICHICKRFVNSDLTWPDLNSASLDHIIPLSVPGSPGHVMANVALAHLRCNMSKNYRVRGEDWQLYRELLLRSSA
jgi:HNH endonuclease